MSEPCHGDVCITCSDTAVQVTVVRLLDDELAVVRTPAGEEEAGFRALTLRTMAADFSGIDDVTLEPWVMPDGVGLLAHAPRRRHETVEQHGVRLGRAVGRAWAGEALDGREVASVRASQLDDLGDNPARDLALSVLSSGQPSLLQPLGAPLSVAAASSADLERIRTLLAEEPLRAALLENGAPRQSTAAARALSDWLAPVRARSVACSIVERPAARPGVWSLASASPELSPARFVAVPLRARRELGQATAWLLNRPGGYLDQTLATPGLVATAHARYWGGVEAAGLLLTLDGETDQLAAAEQQARALLDSLARTGFSADDVRAAQLEQATRLTHELSSPRGRVVQLWYGHPSYVITPQDLRVFLSGLAAEKQQVVRLTRSMLARPP